MRTPEEFKRVIERAPFPVLGTGTVRIPYSTTDFDLRAEAVKHLVAGGYAENPGPLEGLHRELKLEHQTLIDGPASNSVSINIASSVPSFLETYRRLVKHLARNVLGFDVLFEKDPPLRFHFPVPMPGGYRAQDGTLLLHHTDTLFGDPFEMLNCWVPLTRSFGSATLLLAGLDESIEMLAEFCTGLGYDEAVYKKGRNLLFDALCTNESLRRRMLDRCKPADAEYGEILMFDPRSFHGTAENFEDSTRVSLDFRLIAVEEERALELRRLASGTKASVFAGSPLVRGGYFDSVSAFEL
jgi:hypothetical protein